MKNILITGSTDGIGNLAALKLACDGHQILLHGRDQAKLNSTIAKIKSFSKNENIFGFVADFSDLSAVKKMAAEVKSRVETLDVLVNNAGIYNSSLSKNNEGFEMRYVVNYLSPYLLTQELLPLLSNMAGSRVINLSSAAQSDVSIRAINGVVNIPVQAAYAQSKLALTMWSFYMAEKQPNISVIALNPGSLLNTKMVKEAFGHHWSPAEKGADIIYDLAVSQNFAGITGKYFDNDSGGFSNAHPQAYNKAAVSELITFTENLLN